MFWISYLQKLVRALNDNTSPNQLAAGFALGALIGLLPGFNLLVIGVWLVVLLLQVHIGMALASAVIFAIIAALTDPLFEKLGLYLLTDVSALKGFWTTLYNTPIVPFTDFNNTLVMGNLVGWLALAVPIFLGFRTFVIVYRKRLRDRIAQWKIVQAIKATSAFDLVYRWFTR